MKITVNKTAGYQREGEGGRKSVKAKIRVKKRLEIKRGGVKNSGRNSVTFAI